MFVVLLKFSENRGRAGELMDGHNAWINSGLDAGVFLVVGKLQPDLGGAVLAHSITLEALQALVEKDPFVAENVVSSEILEITPGKTDARLQFLLN